MKSRLRRLALVAIRDIPAAPLRSAVIVATAAAATILVSFAGALGNATDAASSAFLDLRGTRVCDITIGAQSDTGRLPLTDADVFALREHLGSRAAFAPIAASRLDIRTSSTATAALITGVDQEYYQAGFGRPFLWGALSPQDAQQSSAVCVLSRSLAAALGALEQPASPMDLLVGDRRLRVVGVETPLRDAPSPDTEPQILRLPLEQYRALTGASTVTFVLYSPFRDADITPMVHATEQLLVDRVPERKGLVLITDPVRIRESFLRTTRLLRTSVWMGALVLLLLGTVASITTSLAAVRAREREIGLKRAIGARRSDIASEFTIETIILMLVGVGAAFILMPAILAIVPSLVQHTPEFSPFRFLTLSPSNGLLGILAAAAGSALGVIIPVSRAVSIAPTEALRA